MLGRESPWTWTDGTYIRLRDELIARAAKRKDHTRTPQRLRRVHKALQTYIRATRLVQKACSERDDLAVKPKALAVERWLTDLKAAWTAAGLLLPEDEQPRYTRVEAGMIYAEGTRGQYDPRYGLWLLLGLEGRPVQILRARRSHLGDEYPDTPRGVFRGPGTRLKHGLVYAPTPAHRVKIDEYLDGYLSQYEAKYQRREIADYPLFVSGDLGEFIDGKVAPFRENVRPWGYRQFLGNPAEGTGYYAIEAAAGVKHVPGRGPYALKYTAADLAPLAAGKLGIGDAVAVNLATAHDTPGTAPQYRRKVRSQPGVLVTVGKIIWEIRKDLREAAAAGVDTARWGLNLDEERIRRFRVRPGGIAIQTLAGDELWVPWIALTTCGGQEPAAVHELAALQGRWSPRHVTLDDEARELHLPHGVVLQLETHLLRARLVRHDGTGTASDPELRRMMW